MRQNKLKLKELPFQALLNILFLVLVILCVYPFYYILVYSLSDPDRAAYAFLYPIGFNLDGYRTLFQLNNIFHAAVISALRTVLGTLITVTCTSFAAYLVTKREMMWRTFVYRFFVVTMYLNAGLIPWYLTMRAYGLKNNFLLYILPGAVSAYYMILTKTYMESLPESLEESAMLDGAGYVTIFWKIILPLSKPIIATVAIYNAVNQWNSWSDNYFLVSDENLQTLQLILYNYLNSATNLAQASTQQLEAMGASMTMTPMSIKMCITVITTLPIMCVYPFLQKHFAKGIMIGAVKG